MKKWAILLVFLSAGARAEPGPTVNWLMSTPMTLFDRGMDKLDADVKSSVNYAEEPPATTAFGYASYDWTLNEIVLRVNLHPKAQLTDEDCTTYRQRIEFMTYFGGDTEAEKRKNIADFLDRQFAHFGFQEKARPDKLGENMASIVYTEVAIYQPAPSRELLTCRGRIGDSASYKREQRAR